MSFVGSGVVWQGYVAFFVQSKAGADLRRYAEDLAPDARQVVLKELDNLRRAADAYLVSVRGQLPAELADIGASSPAMSDEITTSEAAELLHVHPRTAQRMAPRLGGRRLGERGPWVIPRSRVMAAVAAREVA